MHRPTVHLRTNEAIAVIALLLPLYAGCLSAAQTQVADAIARSGQPTLREVLPILPPPPPRFGTVVLLNIGNEGKTTALGLQDVRDVDLRIDATEVSIAPGVFATVVTRIDEIIVEYRRRGRLFGPGAAWLSLAPIAPGDPPTGMAFIALSYSDIRHEYKAELVRREDALALYGDYITFDDVSIQE